MNDTVVVNAITKPYVGLRPFETWESELFFGREEQIKGLLNKLHEKNFVAVVGSSGLGKSSLVKAGLIPALKAGFLNSADHWFIAAFRPGDNPIYYLARALVEGLNLPLSAVELEKSIQREGSAEVIEQVSAYLDNTENSLLILVDQFEEVFTHFKNISEQSALMYRFEFVKILLELIHSKLPIYVIITMRSDFLGKCNMFHGLAEELSESQFLVPRLHSAELHRVIEGPMKLFGCSIEPGLTQKILNDLKENEDQLPVLEHALSQIWRNRTSAHEVTYKDYEAIGKLENALSAHANAIHDDLVKKYPRLESVIREMFQFIIDFDGEKREGVRQPRKVHEIQRITGATFGDIKTIFEAFSVEHASFLYSPSHRELDEYALIDISHESLMREWDKFKEWKEEEERHKRYVERLNDFAAEFRLKKREVLRGPELGLYRSWSKYQEYKDNASREKVEFWAKRYRADFGNIAEYIKISNWKSVLRISFIGAGLLLLFVMVLFALNKFEQQKLTAENYRLEMEHRQLKLQEAASKAQRESDSTKLASAIELTTLLGNESAAKQDYYHAKSKLSALIQQNAGLQKALADKEKFIRTLQSNASSDQRLREITALNENMSRDLRSSQAKLSQLQKSTDSLLLVIGWYKKETKLSYNPANNLALASKVKLSHSKRVPLSKGNWELCLDLRGGHEELMKIDKVLYFLRDNLSKGVADGALLMKTNHFEHCLQIKENTPIHVEVVFKDKSSKLLDYKWSFN